MGLRSRAGKRDRCHHQQGRDRESLSGSGFSDPDFRISSSMWDVCERLRDVYWYLAPAARDEKQFRGGLVFKAYRCLYVSTLGSRVMKKKEKMSGFGAYISTWPQPHVTRVLKPHFSDPDSRVSGSTCVGQI